jgi:diguanylate cyclase (GGDEF)-like protein
MLHFVGSQATVFLSILYPVGDVVLLAIAVVIVVLQVKVFRSFLFLLGIAIFTATDLIFLWKSATTGYSFASLVDDGWLLGLLIMAEALWHSGGEAPMSDRITSIAATIALIFSSTILITAAVKRGYFPAFALVPAIITIALAFIRMGIALREARSASQDRELARIDELTGLANRRRFLAEIDALTPLDGTLLLMDLDGFKSVNDTLGHSVGDELLQHIAVRFSRVIPADALLARLGGDEFGVIVHGGAQAGLDIALALRSSLSYPFNIGTSSINVDVSIGRVINDGAADLMRRADIAMYQAKNSGGGIVLWQEQALT